MLSNNLASWQDDWLWGLPLVVLTIVVHVFGLGFISEVVTEPVQAAVRRRRPAASFAITMGVVALLVTLLHAIGGIAWAIVYYLLGALPDVRQAVLYSLSAVTAYGHTSLLLQPHWQLMGALEALNGLILFGLTTAFMFAMIGRVWPDQLRARRRYS